MCSVIYAGSALAVFSVCWRNKDYSCGVLTLVEQKGDYIVSCEAEAFRPGTCIANSGYAGYNVGQMRCTWACSTISPDGKLYTLTTSTTTPGSLGDGTPCEGSGGSGSNDD